MFALSKRSLHDIRAGLRQREGFAMFMAIGAMVIIGVLVAGSSFVTMQEQRLGQNSVVQARAFAAAEYGLNKIQADWDKTPNLQMNNGAKFDTSYTLAGQGTANVRYIRLNNETFWIVSEGRATADNPGTAARTAVKRVGAVLRLRIPTIRANGAITTAGNISVKGSGEVHGENYIPPGWSGCDVTAPNKAGIVATPTASVDIQKASSVTGSPLVTRDPLAADSNTYVRYGDETWQALVAQANITITGGEGPNAAPVAINGSCDKSNTSNWGEPLRTAGSIAPCYNYFPIIYSTGSLHINNGRGQGILLVDGDIRMNGNFQWYGLIVARDDIIKGNGTADIHGAVMARNANIADPSEVLGNITFRYSQCSLERAMRGSAQVVQAKERAWTELY